jgi:hypothetical protein
MRSAILERVCPYCGSNKLRFLEHGSGGTLFQCELCARATVQRWEPEREAVHKTAEAEEMPK